MPRLMLTALVALTGLLALAASASAKSTIAPCREDGTGPKCHFWNAKAVFIADGDTVRVRVDGDKKLSMIRFIGINAMELSRYSKYADRRRGTCHGLEATALVDRMIKASGRRIRLSAQHPGSRTGHRVRRSVWVKSGGRWRDLARMVVEQGHALWLPNPDEWAHNGEYHELAVAAAAAGKNLWNPDTCGVGPSPGAPLQLSVKWDADGNDAKNINGEWVDIRNTGTADVPLAGWWFRDSWLNYNQHHIPGFEFPAGAVVPAGGMIRLHMGRGSNSATEYYWGRTEAVFEDANPKKRSGDGGYLFDPQGDLRAHSMYPCVGSCTDALAGAVKLAVQWQGQPEFAAIANVSTAAIDLSGYVLKLHLNGEADRFIFGYALPAGTTLAPGETLKVFMNDGPGPDGRLTRSLHRGQFVLPDGPKGNVMTVRSPADVPLACQAWNASRCR